MRKVVSGLVVFLLLTSMLALVFTVHIVRAQGTIYIRADGSVEGTTSIQTTDNVTYVFTANTKLQTLIVRAR